MPCPQCSHTMTNLGVQDQRIFWCPRCGTIKSEAASGDGAFESISRPFLATRVADLVKQLDGNKTHDHRIVHGGRKLIRWVEVLMPLAVWLGIREAATGSPR